MKEIAAAALFVVVLGLILGTCMTATQSGCANVGPGQPLWCVR